MREGENGRSNCPVPGDVPVSSILDQFCWLNCSEGDLEIAKLLNFGVIMCHGELSTEYCIEVDGSPIDDVFPF